MKDKINHIFLVGILLILTSTGTLFAQNTTKHNVQSGETLFQIANQYEVSVQQIKDWNNLSGNQLSIGQTLIIRQPSAQSQSGITHTVQPKETLYSISKKYNVSIAEIKEWNNLQGQNLSIGTKLQIHPKNSQTAASTDTTQGESIYTVKSGDSLFRIARIHNMTVARLKEINGLSSSNIQVGQKLAVRPTDQPPSLTVAGVETSAQGKFIRYSIDKSQTLSKLLQKFQMSPEEFEALNPGLNDTTFRRGEKVTLLAPANQSFKNPYTLNSSMRSLGSTQVTPYKSQDIEPTTSGELYNPEALTAAHSSIAMGSLIFVRNTTNDRGVLVRINDRTTGNSLKLSDAVWDALALTGREATVTMFSSDE